MLSVARRTPGSGRARISTSPAEQRRRLFAPGAAPTAAHDALHARDDLLGVARLGDPVVGPEAQPADPLGDGRGAGADDDAELGERLAQALEPAPGLRPEHRQVDDQRAQAHRHDGLAGDRALEHAVLPAEPVQRLQSTWMKPLSRSRTAIRRAVDGDVLVGGR